MSFDVCLVALAEAEKTHGEKSPQVAEALENMITVLRQEGKPTKCLPLLLRLKEIRQDLGQDCTETKNDIRHLLLTKEWPVVDHAQDDAATPSSSSSAPVWASMTALSDLRNLKFDANFSAHADTLSQVAGSVGSQALSVLLRGSSRTAELASGSVSSASYMASALCLESGRTKTAAVFKALDLCSRTAGSTVSYASSIGAVCIENAAQPLIAFSTRRLLDGVVVTAQTAHKSAEAVWGVLDGVYRWTVPGVAVESEEKRQDSASAAEEGGCAASEDPATAEEGGVPAADSAAEAGGTPSPVGPAASSAEGPASAEEGGVPAADSGGAPSPVGPAVSSAEEPATAQAGSAAAPDISPGDDASRSSLCAQEPNGDGVCGEGIAD